LTVEQRDCIAAAQAQDRKVTGCAVRQSDLGPEGKVDRSK
jgi:hypothetical protein